jgi:hypothetical protein
MNVKEVIEKLQRFRPNSTVFIADPKTCDNDRNIGRIEIDPEIGDVAMHPGGKLKAMRRKCNVCGKRMKEGYCIDGGAEYYCSEPCLHTKYTKRQWNNMYEDGGDSYWTEWE